MRYRFLPMLWCAACAGVLCTPWDSAAGQTPRDRAVLSDTPAPVGAPGAAVEPAYRTLPGGSFVSVESDQPVAVAPFELRVEPVTRAEFRRFVMQHPEWGRNQVDAQFADSGYLSGPDELDAHNPDVPVTSVSWFAANAFCESESARLPSWIEWEYAAAADESRTDARSDPAWREQILAWYATPASSRPRSIGGAPNAYGIRDLHGLIWEWVDDFGSFELSGDSRSDGNAKETRFCGAGALSLADKENFAILMRIALLGALDAAGTTRQLGFRCARPAPR